MDNKEDCKLSRTSKLSKDLMYADYAGSTVVEHVLKSLEKKSNFSPSEEINRFLKTNKKRPEAFERAKNLVSLIAAHHEESVDDKEAIEEEEDGEKVMEDYGGEGSDCDSDGYKADVFLMPQSQSQELDSSDDDENQEKRSWISFSKANLLDSDSSDDSSSDSSEEETLQKLSESTGRKNLIEVIEDQDRSPDINGKSKLNFSVSTGKRKFCNNIQNDSSVESNDESSDGESSHNFFVSTKRKKVRNSQ